ncbi:MATE family efflux transporter [bacterium]|nr:MATE family efflux transporter [bacterium]
MANSEEVDHVARPRVLADEIEASGDRARYRLIWRLAIPVLLQNFLGMFVGWSDSILAGQILGKEEYLAAGVVSGYLLWFMESLGSVVYVGSQAIISRLLGARDSVQANRVLAQSMLLSVLFGLVLGLGVFVTADQAAALMSQTGPAGLAVAQYLRIVSVSAVPMMILVVGTTCLRAGGHNRSTMMIYLLVNAINIAVSWILAVGLGPIPAMGWVGIATGTAISFFVGGVATLVTLIRGFVDLKLASLIIAVDVVTIRRILGIGIPGAASSLVIVICQLWFLAIIGRLGETATAAHGVAIRCESMSWLWGESFSIAAATLVGQSLGAGRPLLARRYGWGALLLSTVVLCGMGLLFLLIADQFVMIFARAEASAVRIEAASVLRIIALGMPALSASIVLTGALRGAGDVTVPFLYNSVGMLAFRIPLAYALTGGIWSLGLWGAWLAMVADLYARGLFSLARFLADGWLKRRV